MKWNIIPTLCLVFLSGIQGFRLPTPRQYEHGVTPPLGFFDPLGLSNGKTRQEFKKLQEAEVKHSRVAMLAITGLVIQNRFNGLLGLHNPGKSIYHFEKVELAYPFFGLFFLILVASIEIANLYKDWTPPRSNLEISVLREDYIPGDLGLNFIKDDPKRFSILRNKELNNGRLAMIATVLYALRQIFEPPL
jgi:hypothetical protein